MIGKYFDISISLAISVTFDYTLLLYYIDVCVGVGVRNIVL